MEKSRADEPIPQAGRDRITALKTDLDDALATLEWQRRSLSRLKAVISKCRDEGRAPTIEEVNDALHDGTRMAA